MAIKSYLDMTGLDTFHSLVIASAINSSNFESTKTAPSIKALIDYLTVGDGSIGATIDSIQSDIEDIYIELEKKSNTDENVKSTVETTTKAYLVASTSNTTSTGTLIKDTGVYLDTTAGKLVATTFSGSLSGNADTASKVKTITRSTNATHYISFIDSNNSSSTAETVYTDANLTYNPSTNTLSTTTFSGALSGNANTATKLKTAVSINDTSFDGSASITTEKWGQARNISISDSSATNTGDSVSVSGDSDVTLKLPATIKATLKGNSDTASVATKLGTSTIGSATKPIYLNGGTPTAISYTLGTASQKDFPASGNASSTQVVLGSDTRLTDSRTPKAHTHSTDDIVSGTLPVERGGTGLSSYTAGDIIYASDTNVLSKLAKGTNGQVLKLSGGVPVWGTDNNTWKQNTTSQEGYVVKASTPNRIYAVGASGNPTWLQLTNAMITDGIIENTKLRNSSVTVGSATISLGGSATLANIGAASVSEFSSFKDSTNETLALKENKSSLKGGAYKAVDTSISTSSTSTNIPTTKAVSDFVEARINAKISASDAMIYKGTLGTNGTITALPTKSSSPLPLTGWTYKVITAGTYAGQKCEVGDMVVCLTDATSSVDPTWTVIQSNIDGAVITATTSSTDGHIVLFSGTTGNKIKSSGVGIVSTISDSDSIPTASAVKTFVEGKKYVTSSGVTSVGLSLPSIFSVTGSPVTTTGTLTGSLKTQNVNTVFAGPSSGSAAAPTFRKLVAADLPGTYAGSSTAATSANKLNTDAGSSTEPVYFSNGVPVALTYSIAKSVPANAVFTDTHYTAKNVVSSSNTGTSNVTAATSNPYINLIEDGAVRSTHRISGSGATAVTTDTSGNIIISSKDTKYTHPSYTARTSGLYNITVDATGHVSGATAVTKSDITDLGIPGSDTNTTYTFATGSKNGTISVTPSGGSATDVAVKGLGSAAYTNSSAYATSGHTHNYAGSSSVGGAATSANKLNTNAGSANTPVYFSNGIPVAIDYTISKSVPSNAEFTDTKVTQSAVKDSDYTNYRPLIFGSSNSGTKGFTPTTVTDVVYACTGLYVKPASGLIHATTFEGALSGNASTATTATNSTKLHTVTSSTNADHFLTFVDSNNSSATSETVYTDGSLKYNPNTNTLTATTFNGNATSATNDSNGNRITSTYLPLSGGTMTGTIVTRSNTGPALNLRNESSYMSTINYDTSGNEALAINLKNTVTSFMVNHGVDGSQWTANGKWTGVTPTLQAKNKCVYINELIPNGTSPSYNLKVNGTSYFSNKVYIGSSSSYISYNNSTGALEFNC